MIKKIEWVSRASTDASNEVRRELPPDIIIILTKDDGTEVRIDMSRELCVGNCGCADVKH